MAKKRKTLAEVAERHRAMYELWRSGMSLAEIAKLYRVGITAVLYHIRMHQKAIGERE